MTMIRTGVLGLVAFLIASYPAAAYLSAQTNSSFAKSVNPAMSRWQAQIPSIEKVLSKGEVTCPGDLDVHVMDASGSTENDPSVALVDVCGGGAYTDWIVVMRMEHGQPVVARFRNRAGQSVPNGFASGASVMHSVDVKLMPTRKAVYERFADNDSEGRLSRCGVKAYVWNHKKRTFDADQQESRVASDDYCRILRKSN